MNRYTGLSYMFSACLCEPEELAEFFPVESRSYHCHHARGLGVSVSDLALARHVVEFEPAAVSVLHDALDPQDLAALVEAVDDLLEFSPRVPVAGLGADLIEDLVGVVAVVMMVVMVIMAAAALVVVVVVMFMIMIVVMMVLMLVLMLIVVIVMIVMMVFMFMLMLVLMFVRFELLVGLFSQPVELGVHRPVRLHDLEHLLSGELFPVGGHDLRCRVQRPYVLHDAVELFGAHPLLVREEYGARVLDLVRKELAEVLHVHPVSLGVHHRGEAV